MSGAKVGKKEYDIVIIGGGIAGVFAALGARGKDTSVLLIELSNMLGGQGTAGGVAGFCGDTRRVNKPFKSLITTLEKHQLIQEYDPKKDRLDYELEPCAYLLQEMCVDAGVDIMFKGYVVETNSENGQIKSVTVSTGAGQMEICAKQFIDATGDCRIVEQMGIPLINEGVNKQLPMSLYFTMWDTGQKIKPQLLPGCQEWNSDDEIPMTSLHRFETGKVEVKMKVVGFDASDPIALSEVEIFARRQMMSLVYFLQTKGYKGKKLDQHVIAFASKHIGIRESNRIMGEYSLTEQDLKNGKEFDDAIAVGTYHLDFHWPDKMERADTGITTMVPPYHIPLNAVLPKDTVNILVPGRGLCGDQMAMSSYRVMATCAQTGFATGIVAKQSCEKNISLRELDIKLVQQEIEEEGQSLNLEDYGEYLNHIQLGSNSC
ncbi:MAG: hypothetical protein COA79_09320 [Planctomycetota bacterium]|nr:MAG: hypothetical protein COA79_09320 [Planctomycetota bacterium]